MEQSKAFFFAAIPWLLIGCAGFGVVATSDPLRKLNDASHLFHQQSRPLIAERLIWEAMDIYRERRDFHGLGHAHREYADLLLSPSVVKYKKSYREHGFRDSTITYDTRVDKAKEYFARAMDFYRRAEPSLKVDEKYGFLTNLYFNMAYASFRIGEAKESCEFAEKSLDAYAKNIAKNPEAKPYVPSEYSSYENMMRNSPMIKDCP